MKLSENINFNIILEVEDNLKNLDENLFVYVSHKNSYICERLFFDCGDAEENNFLMDKWYLAYREKGGKISPVSTREIIDGESITHAATQKSIAESAAHFFVMMITTTKGIWSDFLLYASLGLKLYRKNGCPDKMFWKDFCEAVCTKLPKQMVLLNNMSDEVSIGL